jgi:hypothetical protein
MRESWTAGLEEKGSGDLAVWCGSAAAVGDDIAARVGVDDAAAILLGDDLRCAKEIIREM